MTENELKNKLSELLNLNNENEVVEFKEAKTQYDFHKLGKYFSALSNEANLKNVKSAWLIFGIENKSHKIVGSKFKEKGNSLQDLKNEIANKTVSNITFIEIYELLLAEGRIILFEIPPAPHGIPISFEGHYYGRDGESLVPLNIEEIERIRTQSTINDWSKEIVNDATIDDLDQEAIAKAKEVFIKRNPKYNEEIKNWSNSKFLDKAKITIKGKITRTALILLGKEVSEHFLNSTVKIRWNLKTVENQDKDYEIFSIPLILAVEKVYSKIRNLKYRYLKDNTLFPDEFLRYDPFSIREPLNNAIAHQDYTKGARINVVEIEDEQLIFTNYGSFIPGSIEKVVLDDSPEEKYRNPFLVEAMKNLDMVETQGGGIRKIFNFQKQRFFPMPEYDFSGGKVKVTITGKILDVEFARILANNKNLSLEDVLLLDKVQKKKKIKEEEYKYLKTNKFVEGRKGNLYLSLNVIKETEDKNLKIKYIRNRAFNDAHYKDMIIAYLKEYKHGSRADFEGLISPNLSDVLTEKQKKDKVKNLLQTLRKDNIICLNDKKWSLI